MAPFLKILLGMSKNHVPSFMLLSQNAQFLYKSALLLAKGVSHRKRKVAVNFDLAIFGQWSSYHVPVELVVSNQWTGLLD